jgi:hypothetical protein
MNYKAGDKECEKRTGYGTDVWLLKIWWTMANNNWLIHVSSCSVIVLTEAENQSLYDIDRRIFLTG